MLEVFTWCRHNNVCHFQEYHRSGEIRMHFEKIYFYSFPKEHRTEIHISCAKGLIVKNINKALNIEDGLRYMKKLQVIE